MDRLRSPPLPLLAAAAELGLTPHQVRYAIERGAPVVRRGRPGPGGATLVDPSAIRAWLDRSRREIDAVHRELAKGLVQDLAEAACRQFQSASGPHKLALAGAVIEQFIAAAQAVHARLELPAFGPDEIPACVRRLIELGESDSRNCALW